MKALFLSFWGYSFFYLRLSAVAEVEDREKARAAVRADDNAEVADGLSLIHI